MSFLRIEKISGPRAVSRSAVRPDGIAVVMPGGQGDDYRRRLLKLVPAESLALYPFGTTLLSLNPTGTVFDAIYAITWFAACLGFTVALRWVYTKGPGQRPQYVAIAVAAVSFVLWVLNLNGGVGPFVIPVDHRVAVMLLAALWVNVTALIYRGD